MNWTTLVGGLSRMRQANDLLFGHSYTLEGCADERRSDALPPRM